MSKTDALQFIQDARANEYAGVTLEDMRNSANSVGYAFSTEEFLEAITELVALDTIIPSATLEEELESSFAGASIAYHTDGEKCGTGNGCCNHGTKT